MRTKGSSLWEAIKAGDPAAAARALRRRPLGLESREGFLKWTPAMLAANNGDVECLKVLIGAGADLDAEVGGGFRAAHFAIDNGHPEALALLLSHGARARGLAARACWMGQAPCLAAALGAGGSPSELDEEGFAPLTRAACAGSSACVEMLLRAGAPVVGEDPVSGRSAAEFALLARDHRGLSMLLAAGADPDEADAEGATLLMKAADMRSPGCVAALIKAGAVLDIQGPGLKTAAMLSVLAGDADSLRLLLESGASADLVDSDGHDLLGLARARSEEFHSEAFALVERRAIGPRSKGASSERALRM